MSDKIKFVDISYLERAYGYLEAKRRRAAFCPHFISANFGEEDCNITMDVFPYVELTQFQCQIIRDNIAEVIRFADTGRK